MAPEAKYPWDSVEASPAPNWRDHNLERPYLLYFNFKKIGDLLLLI